VRTIASLANADPHLTRIALRHLLYYGCLVLLDVFSFAAIYAPTPEIAAFVADAAMQDECARYVSVTGSDLTLGGGSRDDDLSSREKLISLYASLKQGQSLKTWCVEHGSALAAIDVRRFVTFGVIKGFLYRVHNYAIATTHQNASTRSTATAAEGNGVGRKGEKKHSLGRYLDGTHCFDEICTELGISERELVGELKRWGDVQIVHR